MIAFTGETAYNWSPWRLGLLKVDWCCNGCVCVFQNGVVECRRIFCPPANCSEESLPVHVDGSCCKKCRREYCKDTRCPSSSPHGVQLRDCLAHSCTRAALKETCWCRRKWRQSGLEQPALKRNPNLLQPRAPALAVGRDVELLCWHQSSSAREQRSHLSDFPRQLKRKRYFK